MARRGRGLGGRRAGGARHAAALLAAAGGRGHRRLRLAVGDGADGRAAPCWRGWAWGIGHFAVGSYWILEAFYVPPADFALLGPPIVAGLAVVLGFFPGLAAWAVTARRRSLARPRRALSPPGRAGDRLDGGGMAARAPLHRLSVESAGPRLGLCHAFATGRGAVRRLWPGHVDLPRARGADGRLAGLDRGAGGRRPRGLSPASR